MKTCVSCLFWDVPATVHARMVEEVEGGLLSFRKTETFACRRMPPVPDPRRPMAAGEAHRSNWPMTEKSDWCGEWQMRADNTQGAIAGATA